VESNSKQFTVVKAKEEGSDRIFEVGVERKEKGDSLQQQKPLFKKGESSFALDPESV